MGRKQLRKSEQIRLDQTLVMDYDQPLTRRTQFIEAFTNALQTPCQYIQWDGHTVYYYEHHGRREYFLTGAITWLSGPHPLYKKRLQLKNGIKIFMTPIRSGRIPECIWWGYITTKICMCLLNLGLRIT